MLNLGVPLDDCAGLKSNAPSDADVAKELCNGIRLAIREEQSIGSYLFVPECRVLLQKSTTADQNDKIVVYNSFSKFKAYKVDNIQTDDIKISALTPSQEATKKKLTFKNDQYTSQSLIVLHDTTYLEGLTPYKQSIFKSKDTKELMDLAETSVSDY